MSDEFSVTAKVRGVSVDRATVDLYDQNGIWLTRVDVRVPSTDLFRGDAATT